MSYDHKLILAVFHPSPLGHQAARIYPCSLKSMFSIATFYNPTNHQRRHTFIVPLVVENSLKIASEIVNFHTFYTTPPIQPCAIPCDALTRP